MEKIAVIGLSCLFPGGDTPEAFWRNLQEGRDCRCEVADEKMGVPVRAYYDPEKGKADRFYCLRGGYVEAFEMDPGGFELPPERVREADDGVRWSLHVAREAMKESGYWENRGVRSRCGVVLGNLSFPTRTSNRLFLPIYHHVVEASLRELLGNRRFRLRPFAPDGRPALEAGRISGYPAAAVAEGLCLGGPAFSLDAACASSLYAVKLACDFLLSGRADLMLAGAVSAADPLFIHVGFSIFQAYPEEGRESAPLDADSDGLVAGEGAGMFVLKRYEDAVRDGDRIHGVIRGIGWSNDGRGQSVLSPNAKGQVLAFERAYADAGIDPTDVDFVECHATGTPLGDRVEVNSVDAFFGRYGATPLLGAVKSNVGHLLTAAGMASMIKVILAMTRGRIPGTIHLAKPHRSASGVVIPERIPVSTVPWPATGQRPRRAAVSAFGFGGTNAHLVLETPEPASAAPVKQEAGIEARPRGGATGRLAVVGMEAFFGGCEGLEALYRCIYEGKGRFVPPPRERWKGIEEASALLERFGFEEGRAPEGAYIEGFDLDFLHFKIPPNEDDRLIPQQLLALKVTDEALRRAGVRPGGNVAVIVAMEADLALHQMRGRVNLCTQLPPSLAECDEGLSPEGRKELEAIAKESVHNVAKVNQYTSFIGNIMASRISSLWDFSGPSFTVSSEETSVFKALEVARMLLETGSVEAVVVGAVDLAGGVESVLWRNLRSRVNRGPRTLAFGKGVDGWTVGEGAGAVVLKSLERARRDGDPIHAIIDGMGFARGISGAAVEEACRAALAEAGRSPSAIGYLEVHASGMAGEDDAEVEGLLRAYGGKGRRASCAIGSAKTNVGHTFAASGMAALIRAVLCLDRRFLPGTPGWTEPARPERWEGSPFYVPTNSRPWFDGGRGDGGRTAAVSGLGEDGTCCHLVLSEGSVRRDPQRRVLAETPPFLFPLSGRDVEGLRGKLARLEEEIRSCLCPSRAASACHGRYEDPGKDGFRLSIVGSGREEIVAEIHAAAAVLDRAVEEGREWVSVGGSCFAPRPAAGRGRIAFVYPGGFNSYVGLGRDLFRLFPSLYDEASRYTSHLGSMVGEDLLYPRRMNRPSSREEAEMEERLSASPITMFESGIIFAILYTKVMREAFRVEPSMVLGYSMGEVSMMYAMGVWEETDRMSEALRGSPVFRTRLAGPMEAVREAWKMGPAEGAGERIWHGYVLRERVARVREALQGEERAYLIFVNTPSEVVIAGEKGACVRIVERLGCEAFEIALGDAIHCEIARLDYDELVSLHTLPARAVPGIDFYSADRFAPLPVETEAVAANIANLYCHEIDFPRLVERVYADGARVFVETGPRENCTRWIDEILGERPHLAVGVNRKGAEEKASLLRALSRLHAHGVSLDLGPLYESAEEATGPRRSLVRRTTVGGRRIRDAILREENQRRLGGHGAPPEPDRRAPEPGPVVETPTSRGGPGPAPPGGGRGEATSPPPVRVVSGPGSARDRFEENLSALSDAHEAFLGLRREGLRLLGEMVRRAVEAAAGGRIVERPPEPLGVPAPPPVASVATRREENVVWDYHDLREFAEGRIAKVFGDRYAVIDTYRRRVRLPSEPYLLVSRVTRLDAETGVFRPSSITTEYDIPRGAWYSVGGQIPWAVAVESGQCDLLLISYLGIDFECKGDRVYRLLDCTLTFLDDVPGEGDTLRYDIRIDSFARTGGTLLFFFNYDCFVGDRMVLKMRGGCAGFFSDEELEAGKGIIRTEQELEERRRIRKKHFTPLLKCDKTRFEREELLKWVRGDPAGCFGPAYDPGGRNAELYFTAEGMLMLDRVVRIDPEGGAWGLGEVIAEKELAPDDWYFPCHFKDDPVLAGSLMADGCGQLMRLYMVYLGLQTRTRDARFQPLRGLPQRVRCRGQVIPRDRRLTYRMEVKEIGTEPEPYAVADVDILLGDKIVVDFKDLGVVMSERGGGGPPSPPTGGPAPAEGRRSAPAGPARERGRVPLFTKEQIEEFATGSIARCFGEDFALYEGRKPPRTPNGDLQLMDRVLEVKGTRLDMKTPASVVSEYDVPEEAWFFRQNAHPAVMPYSILMEISLQPCGFISAYVGTTLLAPEVDFCFRNLDGEGTLLRRVDLRGKTVTNRSELISTVKTGSTIIQQFRFELSEGGESFYRGTAAFGYFPPEALVNQVGLDGGNHNHPLDTGEWLPPDRVTVIDLRSEEARARLYRGDPRRPHYRLAGPQLDFLDEVRIVPGGGRYGKGYVFGGKRIDPGDWFYPCHFYQDPVMPGSLGVEAILEALQAFVLDQDLGRDFRSPCFDQRVAHRTVWKYRGQLIPTDERMGIEVHVKEVSRDADGLTIVGDAGLWKNDIRIYEVTDAAVWVREAEEPP